MKNNPSNPPPVKALSYDLQKIYNQLGYKKKIPLGIHLEAAAQLSGAPTYEATRKKRVFGWPDYLLGDGKKVPLTSYLETVSDYRNVLFEVTAPIDSLAFGKDRKEWPKRHAKVFFEEVRLILVDAYYGWGHCSVSLGEYFEEIRSLEECDGPYLALQTFFADADIVDFSLWLDDWHGSFFGQLDCRPIAFGKDFGDFPICHSVELRDENLLDLEFAVKRYHFLRTENLWDLAELFEGEVVDSRYSEAFELRRNSSWREEGKWMENESVMKQAEDLMKGFLDDHFLTGRLQDVSNGMK